MRSASILILLILILVSIGSAQDLANTRSYASNDTTSWMNINNGPKCLYFHAKDTCNVNLIIDYKVASSSVWQSYTVIDSTNSSTAAGYFNGWVLRGNGVNHIPGCTQIRLRVTKKVTLNPTLSSTTYDADVLDQ